MCLPTRRTSAMRGVLKYGDDLFRGRLQRLGLLAQPDRLDDVAGDALVEPARDGFNFGKFGHETAASPGR